MVLLVGMVLTACVDMERVRWEDHSRPVKARRIAVSHDSIWVLNAKSLIEEYSGGMWNRLAIQKADRFGVASNGNVAVVKTSGKLLMLNSIGKWHQMNHCFRDVAFGQYGEIYALGCASTRAGYAVLRYQQNVGWKRMKGGGVAIAVDESGDPWVINRKNSLFKWNDLAK